MLFYYYLYIVVGQEGLYLLGPLGEAPASGIEIFLVADVVGLVEVLEAVEIEVVYWLTVAVGILVDDGEGGAADVLLHTQLGANLFNKCRLADAHRAEEGIEAFVGELLEQSTGYVWQLLNIIESQR